MTAVCPDCGQRMNPEVSEKRCIHCAAAKKAADDDCTRSETPTDIDVLERKAKDCGCDDCLHIVRYINGVTG